MLEIKHNTTIKKPSASQPLHRPGIQLLLLGMMIILAGCRDSTQPENALSPSPSLTAPSKLPAWTASPKDATSSPSATPTIDSDLYFRYMPLSQTEYVLPLTIRHVNEDSAVLLFELNKPAAGDLIVRRLTGVNKLIHILPLSPENTRQQITVENLEGGTEYEAIVGLRSDHGVYEQPALLDESWGSVRFHTQPAGEPLRVGVIGDSGFGEEVTFALAEQMAAQELDFAIHTGDLVYRGYENDNPAKAFAYKFYQPLSPILHEMPLYTVPGNHEYESAVRWQDIPFYSYAFPLYPDPLFDAGLKSATGQYYAVAYQDVQFLMLDSEVFWGFPGRESQDAWLKERLSDKRFSYSIPVFHIPPFTSSAVHPEDSAPVRRFWHPLFTSARVPLVLSGHDHHYERLSSDGISYIVSGGGSAALYAAGEFSPQSEFFASRSHFVLLEIYSDRIEILAIDQNGDIFDQTSVPLDFPPAAPES